MGDVNISAILDSFSVSYDKRVRPNYGGEYRSSLCWFIHTWVVLLLYGQLRVPPGVARLSSGGTLLQ